MGWGVIFRSPDGAIGFGLCRASQLGSSALEAELGLRQLVRLGIYEPIKAMFNQDTK
jgi:hypothetical protein